MLIPQMPADSIRRLVDLVERECVRTIAARSQEVADKWISDYAVFLSEGKAVAPIARTHLQLVQEATSEWSAMLNRYLKVFGDSETNFAFWFTALRRTARESGVLPLRDRDETTHDILYRSSDLARQIVFNISWPIAFSSYLPRANSEAALESTAIGLQMSAVMWLETLAKVRDACEESQQTVNYDLARFAKLDALIDICQTRLRQ